LARNRELDPYLRFVHQVMGLDSLHFGLWKDGEVPTLEGVRRAQYDYTTELIGLIPEGARTVLDVGCGIGDTSKRLKEAGFAPEGLAPDVYLGEQFRETCGPEVAFHHSTFEDFRPAKTYHILLFSESPQYIDKDAFFPRSKELTRPGGHLVVADFFKIRPDEGFPNSFVEEDFVARARAAGFRVTHHRDVTKEILPAFELGRKFLARGRELLEFAQDEALSRAPVLARLGRFFLRKKLRVVRHALYEKFPDHLDEEKFVRTMRYGMYRLSR
jgi:MPBQ/MSBQ methyltransferase